MKFLKQSAVAAAALIAILVIPCAARAVSLGVGGTCWYTWWDPYWDKNSHFTRSWGGYPRNGLMSYYHEKNTVKPAPLYGPVLSLSLPQHFKISASFMYGEFSCSGQGRGFVLLNTNFMVNRTSMNIRRYDFDSMISYSVTNFFNVFVGFKYMHYDYKINEILPWGNGMNKYLTIDKIKKQYDEYAPGCGIGFTIPLVKGSFYLLLNGSIIYNFTSFKTTVRSLQYLGWGTLPYPFTPVDSTLSKLGCSASSAFAYYIRPIRTTITAGFRYQMFKLLESDASESVNRQKSLWEHFYGVTFGVMVNINLTPSIDKEYEKGDSVAKAAL